MSVSPAQIREFVLQCELVDEIARQQAHARTRRVRHGFSRALLREIRSIKGGLEQLHRDAWADDAPSHGIGA